jgi:peptidoglycan/LPS O-acetylase OafA/YrhL
VPTLAPITLFFAAIGPTFVMAALSWHLVEKRALLYKPSRWSIKEPWSFVRPA